MKRELSAILLAFAGTSASLAQITFNSTGAGQSVGFTYNGNPEGAFAGYLNFTDPSDSCGIGTSFQTVCVDLDHFISGGQSWNVTCANTFGLGNNYELAGNIVDAMFYAPTNNLEAAALQVAVWEAVYDGGANVGIADFNNGVFQCTDGAVVAQATIYYAAANTPGNSLYLAPLQGGGGQGQMTPVPEPATIAALGLGALALFRRKSRRV